MQTITETIERLTHEELKAYCIQQNQNNLELMAEVERLKTQLYAAGRLANICTTLAGNNKFLREYVPLMEALNEYDTINLKSVENE